VRAEAALDPVSMSFGAVSSGSGQTRTASVQLKNQGAESRTWSLSVTGGPATGVHYSVSPASVTLAPGASTTVVLNMTADQGAAAGGYQAYLQVEAAAHAALYTQIK